MCGRFAHARSIEEATRRFHCDRVIAVGVQGTDIRPTHTITVVRPDPESDQRVIDAVRWGFTFPGKSTLMINARSETVFTRSWRQDVILRRLLIPADAFYEWHSPPVTAEVTMGKKKIPWSATIPEGNLLALAGIAHPSREGLHALILTQPAQEGTVWIHHRQPLIMPETLWDEWLDPQLTDQTDITRLLRPTDPTLMWTQGPLEVPRQGTTS